MVDRHENNEHRETATPSGSLRSAHRQIAHNAHHSASVERGKSCRVSEVSTSTSMVGWVDIPGVVDIVYIRP